MERQRYLVFSAFLEVWTNDLKEAEHIAKLNAAVVIDTEDKWAKIIDYRTQESEADERG